MKKTTASIVLCTLLCISMRGQVTGQPNDRTGKTDNQPAGNPTLSGTRELTASDVEAFFDGLIPSQLAREDIAGATVAVVKDGKLLFAKGYGYADVAKHQPVRAEETLFRPGSVSKLFTWTSVMQLFERGKLDLDRDINDYLDFKIPEAFGKPITLRNLLTHTPGFEEQMKDMMTTIPESPDLGQYLKTHIPARIYPPGTTPAYSNYGAALAGYIVERVSGQAFNEYVTQNIFKPLSMTHSTFAQPLHAALVPQMSRGYLHASDGPQPFEVVRALPAGSLSSTATDLSRFIIAHLQDGQLGEARILHAETAQLMHERQFVLDPATNAMCFGFYEESRNGHRIIGHRGDTALFHSDLHLVADQGLGFFVSYNSAGLGQTDPRSALWEAFLDRYLPYNAPFEPTLTSADKDSRAVSGDYEMSRGFETSFMKSLSLVQPATVRANEDGTIEVDLNVLRDASGSPKRWHEVAPMTFREVGGQDTLIFKPDGTGRMQMILPFPVFVGLRMSAWESPKVLMPVAAGSILIMLLTVILWPIAAIVRKRYGKKLELTPKEKWLRLIVRVAFALNLFFVLAFAGLVLFGLGNRAIFTERGTILLYAIQMIGVLGAAGTMLALYDEYRVWTNKPKQVWIKLQTTLLALASLGFIWFVFAGKLLHFSSNY